MWTIKQEKKLHEKIINEIGSEVNSELVKIEKTLFLNKRDKTMNLQKLIKMHILSKFPLLEEYKDYNKNELSQLRKISPSLIEKIGIESFKYKKMSKDLENNIRKRYSIIGNNLINYFIDFESNLDFFIYKNANKGFTTETLKDMHQKRKQEIFEIEENQSVKIKIAQKKVKMLHRIQRNYFEVLSEKLRWGN